MNRENEVHRILRHLLVCIVVALAVQLPAPAQESTQRQAQDPAPVHPELRPVFEEFGGEAGLVALMDDFMVLLLADERTRPYFAYIDQDKTKKHLVEQFCAILGGGCTYTGRDMIEAHREFEIHHTEFNALVESLQIAMQRRGIPFRAQNKLLAKLAPMHREIINKE